MHHKHGGPFTRSSPFHDVDTACDGGRFPFLNFDRLERQAWSVLRSPIHDSLAGPTLSHEAQSSTEAFIASPLLSPTRFAGFSGLIGHAALPLLCTLEADKKVEVQQGQQHS